MLISQSCYLCRDCCECNKYNCKLNIFFCLNKIILNQPTTAAARIVLAELHRSVLHMHIVATAFGPNSATYCELAGNGAQLAAVFGALVAQLYTYIESSVCLIIFEINMIFVTHKINKQYPNSLPMECLIFIQNGCSTPCIATVHVSTVGPSLPAP